MRKTIFFNGNNDYRRSNILGFSIFIFDFSHPLFLPQISQIPQIPQSVLFPFIEHFEHFDERRREKKSKEKRKFHSLQEILAEIFGNVLYIDSTLSPNPENMTNYLRSDYTSSSWYVHRTSIITVIISDSITGIGSYSFFNGDSNYYDNIAEVQLSKQAKYIGERAFYNCYNLQSLNIPDSVLNIGDHAFYNSYNMKALTLGNNLLYIGPGAFYECRNADFKVLIIPDSVLTIDKQAFGSCQGLISVTIGINVLTIGSQAFQYCVNLTSVNIPQNVETLGDLAFQNCLVMETIEVDPNNQHFKTQDGILFDHGMKILIVCPPKNNLIYYQIPNTITTIKDRGFQYCLSLITADLSSKVTSIQDYTFYSCTSLTSIILPIDLSSIGERAFSGCKNLKSITIPSKVNNISNYAFENCLALINVTYCGTKNPSTPNPTTVFSGSINIKKTMVPNNYEGNTLYDRIVKKGQFCPQQQNSPKFSFTTISKLRTLFSFGYGFIFS